MPFSLQRLFALDAGFYALAAKLVAEGKAPYLDFFYPQMPLLPYVYGAVIWLGGDSWGLLRGFSAVLGAATGCLVFAYVASRISIRAGVVACFLFLSTTMAFAWFTEVISYPLTVVTLLGAFYLLRRQPTEPEAWIAFWAGVLFGLSVGTRLYIAALTPVLVWPLRTHGRSLLAFLCGGTIALLPALALLLADYELFFLNNVEYHQLRSAADFTRDLKEKLFSLSALLGFRSHHHLPGWQLQVLIAASLGYVLWCWRQRTRPEPATWMGWSLFVVSFVPSPVHFQYFSLCIPFFISNAIHLMAALQPRWAAFPLPLRGGLTAAFCAFYLWQVPGDVLRFTSTGIGVPGIENSKSARQWNPASVQKVTDGLNGIVEPGESVLAGWPGYLIASHAVPLAGSENRFGIKLADTLGGQVYDRYKIRSTKELRMARREGKVRVVIMNAPRGSTFAASPLLMEGYHLAFSDDRAGIFVKSR